VFAGGFHEAMLSIECIQAQKCHTDRCPAGVATPSDYLSQAIIPEVHRRTLSFF
jgi:glutamate synthase domain-containing protein 2